jgi:hypothetical protein
MEKIKLTQEEKQILSDLFEGKEWELKDNLSFSDDEEEIKEIKEEIEKLNKLREKVLSSE